MEAAQQQEPELKQETEYFNETASQEINEERDDNRYFRALDNEMEAKTLEVVMKSNHLYES